MVGRRRLLRAVSICIAGRFENEYGIGESGFVLVQYVAERDLRSNHKAGQPNIEH